MFTTALIAALTMSPAGTSPLSGGQFHCVYTGQAYSTPTETIDYNGVRYGTCCGGCGSAFEQAPVHTLQHDAKKGWLVGVSLFDFVSGNRIQAKDAKFHEDYKGVRYLFSSQADLSKFQADPAKYSKSPAKEVLFCPVNQDAVASISAASGFFDYKGARYYTCCRDCLAPLKADPTKYITPNIEAKAKNVVPEAKN